MSNEEDQTNEIEALESIFEQEFQLIEKNKFEIKIPIEVPKHGIILKTTLVSQTENSNNQQSVDFLFHFLPPLTLTISFPPDYPSESPPHVQLKSTWLDIPQLSILYKKLDEVWRELEFTNVVFAWADSLKYCFETLEITEENNSIELHGLHRKGHLDDPRAYQNEKLDPQANLLSLLEYNKELLDVLFKNEDHECRLCFDTFGGKEFTKLTCCGSFYCNYCLSEMYKMNIKEGSVQKVRCPNCSQAVHPSLIQPLTTEEEFARWEYLTFKKAVEGMDDTAYCPRCETLVISDDNVGQCTNCEYVFCTKCLDSYPCSINGAECDNLNALYKQRQTKETEEAIKTLNYMKREGINRRCPVCKMFIEKSSGCNKMTCFNCSNFFCYLCGIQISGYDHFGSNRCALFTNPEKSNQVDIRRPVDVRRAPVFDLVLEGGEIFEFALSNAQKKGCPSCGQKSWKTSKNNDITCWACTKHFCFLCGVATKGTKHFSATGCRQHTDI